MDMYDVHLYFYMCVTLAQFRAPTCPIPARPFKVSGRTVSVPVCTIQPIGLLPQIVDWCIRLLEKGSVLLTS